MDENKHFSDQGEGATCGDHRLGGGPRGNARAIRNGSEEEIRAALMQRLGRKNYIPAKARGDYAQAFFREYRKYCGLPHGDEPGGQELDIAVLAPAAPSAIKWRGKSWLY